MFRDVTRLGAERKIEVEHDDRGTSDTMSLWTDKSLGPYVGYRRTEYRKVYDKREGCYETMGTGAWDGAEGIMNK